MMGFWDFLPWVPDGPGNGTNGGVIRGGVQGQRDTVNYEGTREKEQKDAGLKKLRDSREYVTGGGGVVRGGVTGSRDTAAYTEMRQGQYANGERFNAPRFPAQVAREMDASAARMRELSAFPPPDRWSPSPAQAYNNLKMYPNPELLAWYGQHQPGIVQFMNEAARLDALHREFNSMQQDPRNGPPVRPTDAPVPQQLIDLLSALAEEEFQRRYNSGLRGATTWD